MRDNLRWLGIPAIERTAKGRLFIAWYTGADTEDLGNYVVNIRDLEQKTGIDFFCNLPDNIENREETKDVETIKTQWGL